MVYVQEINYPTTNIRHRYNTGTILGLGLIQIHQYTYTVPEIIQITRIKYNYPSKRENPERGEDTRLIFRKLP